MKNIRSLFLNNKGATAIEYALLVAIIGLSLTGILSSFGVTIDNTFDDVNNGFTQNDQ